MKNCVQKDNDMRQVLQIDPEYESAIVHIRQDEFERLEQSILEEGRIIDPIIVWNNTIVDGHNRYKIAQKYPQIEFSVVEHPFESRSECINWIWLHQLSRRNITPEEKRYLTGKLYNSEKMDHGGYRYDKQSSATIQHLNSGQKTSERIAEQTNSTDAYVRSAGKYAEGIDAVDAVQPGMKSKLLSHELKASVDKVSGIGKMTEDQIPQAIEQILKNNSDEAKEQRKIKWRQTHLHLQNPPDKSIENGEPLEDDAHTSSGNENGEMEVPSTFDVFAEIPLRKLNSQERETDIEDSIIQSMVGAANMFISSCNNFFTRFPKLRTEEKYRKQALEIMQGVENYITEIREDLQNESNQ